MFNGVSADFVAAPSVAVESLSLGSAIEMCRVSEEAREGGPDEAALLSWVPERVWKGQGQVRE